MAIKSAQSIAYLHDQVHKHRLGYWSVVVSKGIAMRGEGFIEQILRLITVCYDPMTVNALLGEHDYGFVEVDRQKIFWRLSHHDHFNNNKSIAPVEEQRTSRLLEIMFARER